MHRYSLAPASAAILLALVATAPMSAVAAPLITPEEAANYPHRNVLYRALGQGEILDPDIFTLGFPQPGFLMLCSDGLWGVVSEQDLVRSVVDAPNLQRACQNLITAANTAGGPDNISVVLVQLIG